MHPHPLFHHLLALLLATWAALAHALPLETIKLPPGFSIELWEKEEPQRNKKRIETRIRTVKYIIVCQWEYGV